MLHHDMLEQHVLWSYNIRVCMEAQAQDNEFGTVNKWNERWIIQTSQVKLYTAVFIYDQGSRLQFKF